MDILRLYFDTQKHTLSLDVSPWVFVAIVALILIAIFLRCGLRRYKVVKLDISLGNIGKVELKPNTEDLQIAHRIWTELVTRKAAIPLDPDHDVIVEVYDSWYALFTKVRELIGNLPADLVRRETSTREIVRISTATLNDGLRPHLTKWQARFRTWYDANRDQLKQKSPQQLQRDFPGFGDLIADMLRINSQLIAYANELKKLLSK
jgi:hypothetical protein